jgi:hypothetical protein
MCAKRAVMSDPAAKGNQGDGANRPSLRFPFFDFPAVECHGSLLFIAAQYSI